MSGGVGSSTITQVVTTAEAQQGGLGTQNRSLSEKGAKRTADALAAHAVLLLHPPHESAPSETAGGQNKQAPKTTSAAEQVDAQELAQAVAQKGRNELLKNTDAARRMRKVYSIVVTPDRNFLALDLAKQKTALLINSKSAVDTAPGIKPQVRAQRKYLLMEIIEAEERVDNPRLANLAASQKKLLLTGPYGDYIQATLDAYENGTVKALKAPDLKQYVHMYQVGANVVGGPQERLKELRRHFGDKNLHFPIQRKIADCQRTIEREKSGSPRRALADRHHLILNEIEELKVLDTVLGMVNKFLSGYCAKAGYSRDSLPSVAELTECALKMCSSAEHLVGVNNTVRLIGSVSAARVDPKNNFMTTFTNQVMRSDVLKNLFKSSMYYRQAMDGLIKHVRANGVAAAGARYATA
ncbi:MAG: hypothetical protein HC848_05380 [Limnobacter sp.]|nr:hypothetical protein [Limnobacter sp.]